MIKLHLKKLLAVMTAAAMAVGMLPSMAIAAETEQTNGAYVLMNIPYDEFYKDELNNTVPVDAFTSATLNKTRTATLAGGSYHENADGSSIDGITYPVYVSDLSLLEGCKMVTDADTVSITVTNRGTTTTETYKGKDALFENKTHAYYVLSETPKYYKTLEVGDDGTFSFGKAVGEVTELTDAEFDFSTDTTYGDYELDIESETLSKVSTVYGVVISTEENDYGLRHVENIWRITKLAWCTGFTDRIHNCPTSSAHYEGMMGQTIKSVTYYTDQGIYKINKEQYVPTITGVTAEAEEVLAGTGKTTYTLSDTLPADFDADYTVEGLEGAVVSDGTITFDAEAAQAGTYKLRISDTTGKYADVTGDIVLGVYVLMNIPYNEFYKAELNNTVPVDAFTSATLNKTRTATLAGGSYHKNADGSAIDGITYPVYITDSSVLADYKQVTDDDAVSITVTNRGTTTTETYEGRNALFENEDYAYYILPADEIPNQYKKLTVNRGNASFSNVVGEVTELTDAEFDFSTDTTYGDYELDIESETLSKVSTVYGVVISTDENDYGLRHVENIWRITKLAWCTGFTDRIHNCPTSSAHYEGMMGQTIKSVTYYTDQGIYKINKEQHVPITLGVTAEVANGASGTGSTTFTLSETLPDGFVADYKVNGLEVTVADGTMAYTDAAPGSYTLTITDESGTYVGLSASFVLSTDVQPAAYSEGKLTAAEGETQEALEAFLANISSVSVNGTEYATSGRNAVTIIKEDGTVDLNASDGAIFANSGEYKISVASTGYPTLEFTMQVTYYMGDVDRDGKVEADDALLILKHVVKLETLTGTAALLAEMDGNNEIEAMDALLVLKTVVKLEPLREAEL